LKSIGTLREINKNADEIDILKEPEVFSLDRIKEGVSEIRWYVHYQGGISILYIEDVSDPDGILICILCLMENK